MTRKKAFTLVEILVTIAIIGILAALMLPMMARARRYAQRAPCISNLRQLAQAALMYKADHDNGALPPRIEALSQSYIKSPALLQCPLDGTHLGYARSVYANVWPDVPGLRRSYGYVGSLRDPALWGTPNDKPDWENGLALFVCQLHGESAGTSLSLMEDNITTARNAERITVFDGLRLRAMPDGSVKIDHFSPHRTTHSIGASLLFALSEPPK